MKKRITLLCLVLCLALPLAAAAQSIEPGHAASLTLRLSFNAQGLPGAHFEVYRVAAVDEHASFRLLPGFDAGAYDINRMEGAKDWAGLALALEPQALLPTAAGDTDENGLAAFDGLKTGLYLVLGYPAEIGGYAYDFAPFLVSLPGKQDGLWVYNPVADVKYQQSSILRDVHVVKYWRDGNTYAGRPESIQVGLFCDGELYSTATLSMENNWIVTYPQLESAHEWTVQEIGVPSGYEVGYTTELDSLIVINTLSNKPEVPPNIPQTGLMWWPVPVLAVLGLALLLAGLMLRRKWSAEHE